MINRRDVLLLDPTGVERVMKVSDDPLFPTTRHEQYAVGHKGAGLEFVPIELPQPGDHVTREGYVSAYRLDTQNFWPRDMVLPDDPQDAYAAAMLEARTALVVSVSEKAGEASSVGEYRLLHDPQLQGAELGMRMALVATVKDALLSQKKVKVHGVVAVAEFIGAAGVGVAVTQPYRELLSIEIRA